jgi:hypothetical protein
MRFLAWLFGGNEDVEVLDVEDAEAPAPFFQPQPPDGQIFGPLTTVLCKTMNSDLEWIFLFSCPFCGHQTDYRKDEQAAVDDGYAHLWSHV